MDTISLIQKITVSILPVLFAITVHEAAHGWMARRCGDSTAWMLGRVSLNPLRHIDPVGTILVPLCSLLLGGIVFGWAKPVPINPRAFRRPSLDLILVALAGPGANAIMAVLWTLMAIVAHRFSIEYLFLTSNVGVGINILLMALNLLPIPPLDGGRVAVTLLPRKMANLLAAVEPYGFIIIIVLAYTGILNALLFPFSFLGYAVVAFVVNLVGYLF